MSHFVIQYFNITQHGSMQMIDCHYTTTTLCPKTPSALIPHTWTFQCNDKVVREGLDPPAVQLPCCVTVGPYQAQLFRNGNSDTSLNKAVCVFLQVQRSISLERQPCAVLCCAVL